MPPGPSPLPRRQLASDNYAGIAPEAWEALEKANRGHAPAYGEDEWTARAADGVREIFETDCEVFFAFNGTASNSLAIASLCQSYHSVICHEQAHVETDECGGPEFFTHGTKVLLARGDAGRIAPDELERIVRRRTDVHYPKPRVLSLTQATEMGTVYEPQHLAALGERAHELGLRVHMDGSRLANAVASLECAPKEITWQVGVDVLCFGGTKQGIPVGDMIVFFERSLAEEFEYRCKQAGQLASKMRFLAAPWVGMLEDRAWLRHARHANRQARHLGALLAQIPGVKILSAIEANSVFVSFPDGVQAALREAGWLFYDFIGSGGARLMCSWDTGDEELETFAADARRAAGEAAQRVEKTARG